MGTFKRFKLIIRKVYRTEKSRKAKLVVRSSPLSFKDLLGFHTVGFQLTIGIIRGAGEKKISKSYSLFSSIRNTKYCVCSYLAPSNKLSRPSGG